MNEMVKMLYKYKKKLSKQQIKTLRGQILAGNEIGALKGLKKILDKGW